MNTIIALCIFSIKTDLKTSYKNAFVFYIYLCSFISVLYLCAFESLSTVLTVQLKGTTFNICFRTSLQAIIPQLILSENISVLSSFLKASFALYKMTFF